MSEEIQNIEEVNNNIMDNEELKEAIQAQMRKIHNQGMVVGFQTSCHTILDRIYAFERRQGSKSTNDYKRIIKEIKKFCETGISRKTEASNDVENTESETVQN